MALKFPPFLKAGSKIAIAATARKVSWEEIQPACTFLESKGFKPIIPEGLFSEQNQFAGSDEHRANLLQQLLNDSSIEAILIARGGYGTVRMIDQLNWEKFRLNPKWIIGFSDITVLLNHINHQIGYAGIHGPMAFNFQPERFEENSAKRLVNLIQGQGNSFTFPAHERNTWRGESALEGTLFGGNLSVIYSLLGSPSLFKPENGLLFLEDLDEYLYHLDRMMMGLKRAGFLNGLKGILVGDMSDMKDNLVPFGKNALEIIAEHAGSIPLVAGLPCGHEKRNLPLVMGATTQVSVKNSLIELTQK